MLMMTMTMTATTTMMMVVAARFVVVVVVGGVLLSGDQLLWVEELSVCAGADLVNDGWLEIDEDGSWDVLASAGFTEEGVE